jgi:hypothetical protein
VIANEPEKASRHRPRRQRRCSPRAFGRYDGSRVVNVRLAPPPQVAGPRRGVWLQFNVRIPGPFRSVGSCRGPEAEHHDPAHPPCHLVALARPGATLDLGGTPPRPPPARRNGHSYWRFSMETFAADGRCPIASRGTGRCEPQRGPRAPVKLQASSALSAWTAACCPVVKGFRAPPHARRPRPAFT